MKRSKVYGKKSRVISAASYNVFTGDLSGADSPPKPPPVLAERSNNPRLQKLVTSNELPPTRSRRTKLQEVQVADQEPESLVPQSPIPQNTIPQSPIPQSPIPKSPRRQRPTQLPTRTSPRKKVNANSPIKTVATSEDLSVIFNELKLNDSPEGSLLLPQTATSKPSPRPATPCSADVPASTLAYLSPILDCKNVSSVVSDFPLWMSHRAHLTLEKIGEGSFGEVFRATSPDGKTVILKLMPLNSIKGRGSRSFTSVGSAANEIRLLERMQRVPGFVEFRGACVLHGCMPAELVKLWNEYRDSGRTVESRDPNRKASYTADQLWLLLEMSDAGRNLEPGQYAPPGEKAAKGARYISVGRTWDIFWEVVKAVAKAEVWAQFEHRDLHLGNVCAKDAHAAKDEEDLRIVKADEPCFIGINRSRVEITIIDYSLSRAAMDAEEDVLFYDFQKDKHILKGEGDLQYDMYRHMAAAVGERPCREFVPETNVLWLWYLLDRLLDVTKQLSAKATKKKGCVTMAARTRDVLEEILSLISPETRDEWTVHSAAALLDLGIERQWFAPNDVIE